MRQVDEVKNIMSDNIEKVLSRGEKLDLLVDKTDNLMFEVSSSRIHLPCWLLQHLESTAVSPDQEATWSACHQHMGLLPKVP